MSCTRCNQRGLPIGSIGYLKVQCSAGLPLASTVVYQPPLLAISRWNTGWESCIYETYIPLLWRASLSFSSHQPYSTYTIYHYSLLLRCFSIVLQSLLLPSSSPAGSPATSSSPATLRLASYYNSQASTHRADYNMVDQVTSDDNATPAPNNN